MLLVMQFALSSRFCLDDLDLPAQRDAIADQTIGKISIERIRRKSEDVEYHS